MKSDISNRGDIELLVNTFYGKVNENKILGYIFTEISNVDWETHLPKMYSFWASMLLGEQSYSGNPIQKHIELSKLTSITTVEFSEWLKIFLETVDELFAGEKTEEAKTRATNIARLMQNKIEAL